MYIYIYIYIYILISVLCRVFDIFLITLIQCYESSMNEKCDDAYILCASSESLRQFHGNLYVDTYVSCVKFEFGIYAMSRPFLRIGMK